MLVYQRVSCLASTGSTESTESTVEPLTTWQVSAFVVFLSAPLWEPFLRFSLGRGGLRMFKKASAFSHVMRCALHISSLSQVTSKILFIQWCEIGYKLQPLD